MDRKLRKGNISYGTAVLTIALVAMIWGFGFWAMRIVLDGGLSVGALMSIRFRSRFPGPM